MQFTADVDRIRHRISQNELQLKRIRQLQQKLTAARALATDDDMKARLRRLQDNAERLERGFGEAQRVLTIFTDEMRHSAYQTAQDIAALRLKAENLFV